MTITAYLHFSHTGKRGAKGLLTFGLFLVAVFVPNPEVFAIKSGDPRLICERFDVKEQPDEAVKCYEEVARANPKSPEAHYFLGAAYIWAADEKSTHKQVQILMKMDYRFVYLLLDGIAHIRPEWIEGFEEVGKELARLVSSETKSNMLSAEEVEKVKRTYKTEISVILEMVDDLPKICGDRNDGEQWVEVKRAELDSYAFSWIVVQCPFKRYDVMRKPPEFQGMIYQQHYQEGNIEIGQGLMHTVSGDVPLYYYRLVRVVDAQNSYGIEAAFPMR